MSDRDTVTDLLASTIYCNVATVNADGTPWNTPVFFGYDNACNLYWRSSAAAQHSRNLADRPAAAITVYNSEQPWGEGQALYCSGTAETLYDAGSTQAALDIMDRRSKRTHQAADFLPPQEMRVYKFTPATMWTNLSIAQATSFNDGRQKLEWRA